MALSRPFEEDRPALQEQLYSNTFSGVEYGDNYKIQSINGEDICNLHNPAPHLHSALEIKPLQSEH